MGKRTKGFKVHVMVRPIDDKVAETLDTDYGLKLGDKLIGEIKSLKSEKVTVELNTGETIKLSRDEAIFPGGDIVGRL